MEYNLLGICYRQINTDIPIGRHTENAPNTVFYQQLSVKIHVMNESLMNKMIAKSYKSTFETWIGTNTQR